MKKLVLLSVALGSLALACTQPPPVIDVHPGSGGSDGGSDDGGAGGSGNAGGSDEGGSGMGGSGSAVQTARDYYLKELHPSIKATCGSCHTALADLAPGWMDNDAIASYELSKNYPGIVVDDPSTSVIITKPSHEGPALTDVQKGLVGKWINMELAEKDSTGSSMGSSMMPPSGPTVDELFAEVAKCMDIDIWTGSGMDKLPYQETNNAGSCYSCHDQGAGGFFADTDVTTTFEMNKQFPYIMRLFVPVYEGSTPKDLAPSLRLEKKGNEPCVAANKAICHPKFSLTPENIAALEKFQSTTLQKFHDGTCGMP
jgi:cytochrome c553